MRLRWFRGRSFRPWRRPRRLDGPEPESLHGPAQQPVRRAGGPGSHRRTGAAPAGGQPPRSGQPDPRPGSRPAGRRPPALTPAGRTVGDSTGPDAGLADAPRTSLTSPDLAGSGSASTAYRPGAVADPAGHARARAAIRTAPPGAAQVASARPVATARPVPAASNAQPWYETLRPSRAAAGLRDCGCLEDVLVREWAADAEPLPETITAINRLADLPVLIKQKLAAGLEAIHVGAGGVPDLDQMARFRGVPLPSGRATWDACAGAYGDRKIIVGSRPSPTPDVMCHEVGHALDDLDGCDGLWQSDSGDFRLLYGRCQPHMASEFHRHDGPLGRREFFADAFAAIASGQRPALVEMLSGDTRAALDVMLYFNVRYGI
jgi:hypothetical protein